MSRKQLAFLTLLGLAISFPAAAQQADKPAAAPQKSDAPAAAAGKDLGRCRVTRMDGKTFEGPTIETASGYVVDSGKGIKVTLKRNEVKDVTPLGAGPVSSGSASEAGPAARELVLDAVVEKLTPEQIRAILGPAEKFTVLEEFGEATGNAMEACPLDQEGLEQMMRIAGPKADHLETPHFVFVYTSDRKMAQQLAARLEAVYRWNVFFMDSLGLPSKRPEYKLEVYFFGTHQEFRAYSALARGGAPLGVLGFYLPDLNRSTFFVMHDWPPIAQQLEQLKDKNINGEDRRRIENRVNRWADSYNLEVVQHEAAHHIHFNIGVMPRQGYFTRWLGEGLAQMFEVEPTALGASLGVTNHERLKQFRQFVGTRESLPPEFFHEFLWDPYFQFGAQHYCIGWAVCNYLWKKDRENFKKFMRNYYEHDNPDELVDRNTRQKHWEEAFGPLDEKWTKEFMKYMNTMQLKTDHLREDWPNGGP